MGQRWERSKVWDCFQWILLLSRFLLDLRELLLNFRVIVVWVLGKFEGNTDFSSLIVIRCPVFESLPFGTDIYCIRSMRLEGRKAYNG